MQVMNRILKQSLKFTECGLYIDVGYKTGITKLNIKLVVNQNHKYIVYKVIISDAIFFQEFQILNQ